MSRPRRGPYLTKRDGLALRWCAEQYGVRLDTLQVVLGRLAGHPGPVSERTARHVADRWRAVDLAQRVSLLGSQWIIPTTRGATLGGLRVADGGGWPTWRPPLHLLEHTHACALARLAAELELAEGVAWLPERHLRREPDADRFHLADAEVRGPGQRVLVEVELTPKADDRVRRALRSLNPAATGLLYLTRPEHAGRIGGQLQRVATELANPDPALPVSMRKRVQVPPFRVEPLPAVAGATYAGRW